MSVYNVLLLVSIYVLLKGEVVCYQVADANNNEFIRPRFRSDYKYDGLVDGWLKLHDTPATWYDAVERCRLEGTALASPITEQMLTLMSRMVAKQESTCAVHTGIHSVFSRGDFYTVDGIPLHNLTVPMNMDKELCAEDPANDCLALEGSGLTRKKCEDPLPFICYRSNHGLPALGNCTSIEPAYKLQETLNSCYKFHPEPKIWSEAFKTCAAEGGNLAIINSDSEMTHLKALFANYPPSVLTSEYKDLVFLGYHVWGESAVYHPSFYLRTIHGQSLEEAGYQQWAPDQPNNSGLCGGMFRNGLLNDVWCHVAYPFICEKDPNGY